MEELLGFLTTLLTTIGAVAVALMERAKKKKALDANELLAETNSKLTERLEEQRAESKKLAVALVRGASPDELARQLNRLFAQDDSKTPPVSGGPGSE